MNILDSLTTGGSSNTNYSLDQELAVLVLKDEGMKAVDIAKTIGRPGNGITYKIRNLRAFVAKKGCTTNEAIFEAIFEKHKTPFTSVEDVLSRVKSAKATA